MVRRRVVALVERLLGSGVVVLWLLRGLFGGGFLSGGGRFRLELHKVVGWRGGPGDVAEGGLELALVLVVDEGRGGLFQEVETRLVLGWWGRGRGSVGLLGVEAGSAG